ncbi:MAG: TIGR03620 family F420-dependent LLM class oxidoreductase [Acidobacteriota bacterium]|nr:TIGR03620 family F420-dependent LLM class oxidoreductase [Acidobacteriota bacterium]MDE3031305.1 TIGR03620 family F420-dependent LLM class oxidoreductase [Acidobacteriota bacterium]MDE3145808.1 TIGR03620 family F420-dependent LLM class oxidoreductase [Acidobacteriota bacterium]
MPTLPSALSRLRGTIGIWTSAHELLAPTPSDGVAADVEALGFSALWFPESWGRESLTSATLLLAATSSLTVATGITNIWGRDAVATVNAARTLNAAFDDRFVLGLGVSHQPLVERLRGHEYHSPLVNMREYLNAMDRAPMHAYEGSHPYARVIAALGPRMLELGSELAHGVHTYLVNVEHTLMARSLVADTFLGVEQAVVVGQGREEFLKRAHAHLEFYTGLENYRANWRRMGFGPDDFVRGGSERLCDAMVVHGDVSDIGERVHEHFSAGADHVCLQVLGPDPATPPRDDWRLVSQGLGLSTS